MRHYADLRLTPARPAIARLFAYHRQAEVQAALQDEIGGMAVLPPSIAHGIMARAHASLAPPPDRPDRAAAPRRDTRLSGWLEALRRAAKPGRHHEFL